MKSNKYLVSIIVPTYNAQNYIGQCIESILNQTYENIELILIDDGSTDNSGTICDAYAKNDGRIKVYHTENSGPSVARNIGLSKISGDYVMFVDSDDWIDINTIKKCVDSLEKYKTDMVIFNLVEYRDNHYRKRRLLNVNFKIFDRPDMKYIKNLFYASEMETDGDRLCLTGICCKMYKSSILHEHTFPIKMDLGEDWCFVCDVLSDINSVVYIGESLYYRRLRKESLSNIDSLVYIKKRLQLINYISERAIKIDYDILNRFCFNEYCIIVTKLLEDNSISYNKKRKVLEKYISKVKFHYNFDKIDYRCRNKRYQLIRYLVKKRYFLLLKMVIDIVDLKKKLKV